MKKIITFVLCVGLLFTTSVTVSFANDAGPTDNLDNEGSSSATEGISVTGYSANILASKNRYCEVYLANTDLQVRAV